LCSIYRSFVVIVDSPERVQAYILELFQSKVPAAEPSWDQCTGVVAAGPRRSPRGWLVPRQCVRR
jgi:hypothetical protein